jgi:hypothetical protein
LEWTGIVKGLICWDARPGDALNILPRPLTYSTIDYRKTGVVSSAVKQILETPYGFWIFNVQTGTGLNNGLIIGQDDTPTTDDIPVSPSSPYSVAVWVRLPSGSSSVPFVLRVKDQTGATLFTSSSFTLTTSWQKVSVSGSTGASSSYISIEVVKSNNATDVAFQAVGFMLVAGSVIPDGYNAGDASNLYDCVTDRVVDANWFLGIHKPYQDDADDSILKLTLTNSDKRYSPEYASSPLSGFLVPYRQVQIQSDDGTTLRTHWTGWLESIQPKPNQDGERTVEVTAAGAMLFFQDVSTSIELQENKRTDEIISALLPQVSLPPALTRTTLLDLSGYSELGVTTYLPDMTIPNTLETGKTTLAYAADNWVHRGDTNDQKKDTFNVYRAIKDVVAAERGRFFFDRTGQAVFWNRHHLIINTTVVATFDNVMTELSYEYAGLGEFKNEVIVTCHPRAVSASSSDLLWQLDKPVTLQPKEVRKLTASYKDDTNNRIGGKDVSVTGVTFSDGTGHVNLTEGGASRAVLELANDSQTASATLATCEVRGTKITDFGQMEAHSRDNTSIAFYGQRTLNMNLASVDNLDYAQTIADFERARRSQPNGKVKSLTLVSHAVNGGGQHTEQLSRTIGDLIRVQEAQTAFAYLKDVSDEVRRARNSGGSLSSKRKTGGKFPTRLSAKRSNQFLSSWGTWIRTKINRARTCRSAVELSPNRCLFSEGHSIMPLRAFQG